MNKRELIEALEALPCSDDTQVFTPGFDDCGMEPIEAPELCKIREIYDKRGYLGKRYAFFWESILDHRKGGEPFEVIHISFGPP